MKTYLTQIIVFLFIVVLLSACTMQTTVSRETEVASSEAPSTPTFTSPTLLHTRTPRPTHTLASPTATPPPTPRATATPIAVARLCPPASSDADWECQDLAVSISSKLRDDVQIKKRYSFIKPPLGGLDVDVWLPSDPDLITWLEKNHATSSEMFPALEPNATVAGHPAVVFVMGPEGPQSLLTVFFGDGIHIYRLWYTITCTEGELLAVRQMLDSFRFAGQPAVPAEIPEDLWQQALDVCK